TGIGLADLSSFPRCMPNHSRESMGDAESVSSTLFTYIALRVRCYRTQSERASGCAFLGKRYLPMGWCLMA
ncbi:MAG TPA: hypothetical protein PLY10_11365, partial [Bacillota bacterium]|nr:hypothetical protein [Bacillota bacterium]